ncbi:MAG: hypothetical protein PVH84_02035 [Candidatus Aminicenantes bacterium]|jgi:hypothetical protein
MKKLTSVLATAAFLLALSSGFVFCSADDISGTWVGETEIPDQGTDELTMVLEKAGDTYTGILSDSFGMLIDTECDDLEYKDNVLTFNISIYDGYSSMTVYITLKVEGNTMTGQWETAEGDTGALTMEKKE